MIKLVAILLSLFKLGKISGTGLTMVISLAVYASVFGWQYAAGFIGLLFVHEMGHFAAARHRGLNVSAPTFIPFVGAWIELKDQPMNVETEAFVAAAGPFLGSIAATLVYLLARDQESPLLLAIAYAGYFLNFFNLIPLAPLDGGRMTAILSPRIWFIGAPIMLVLMLYRPSPLLFVIALISLPSLLKAWKFDPQAPENLKYYSTPVSLRIEYGVFYLGLTAYLGIMTDSVHGMLQGSPGAGG